MLLSVLRHRLWLFALLFVGASLARAGVPISYELPTDGPLPRTCLVTLAIVDPKNPDWIISEFTAGAARTVTRSLALHPGWNELRFRGYCVGYTPFPRRPHPQSSQRKTVAPQTLGRSTQIEWLRKGGNCSSGCAAVARAREVAENGDEITFPLSFPPNSESIVPYAPSTFGPPAFHHRCLRG